MRNVLALSASLLLLSACSAIRTTAGEATMSSSTSSVKQEAPTEPRISSSEGEDVTGAHIKSKADGMIVVE